MTFPYRWTWRTAWSNISSAGYSVYYGVENLIRWAPIVWGDRDWDWAYLAKITRVKLRRSAEFEEKHGHHVGSKRDAAHMRMCAALLDRLLADEYYDNALLSKSGKEAAEHASMMSRQDLRLFGRILGRRMTSWWD